MAENTVIEGFEGKKDLTLVTSWICPFAHRVYMTLLEKDLDFDVIEVDLKNKSEFFTKTYQQSFANNIKSTGSVPILYHKGLLNSLSDLSTQYLAQTFSGGAELIPENTFQRMKMRHFIQHYPSKLVDAFFGFKGFKKHSQQQQKRILERTQAAFQQINDKIVGPFTMGQKLTLADIMFYPLLERWFVIEQMFKVTIDQKYEKIHKLIAAVQARPSYAKSRQFLSNEMYMKGYAIHFDV